APPSRTMVRARAEDDLLREYPTRLIADVVTGKLDVREAAAKLPDVEEDPETSGALDELADDEEAALAVREMQSDAAEACPAPGPRNTSRAWCGRAARCRAGRSGSTSRSRPLCRRPSANTSRRSPMRLPWPARPSPIASGACAMTIS